MINVFIEEKCAVCGQRMPLLDFGNFSEENKLNCGVICFLGNALSLPDVAETLETNLNRLINLAKEANILELLKIATLSLNYIQEVILIKILKRN